VSVSGEKPLESEEEEEEKKSNQCIMCKSVQ